MPNFWAGNNANGVHTCQCGINGNCALLLAVYIFLNGGQIGEGYVSEANTDANQYSPLTIQSTLNLKKGGQVWLQMGVTTGVHLDHDSHHHTHFTGERL